MVLLFMSPIQSLLTGPLAPLISLQKCLGCWVKVFRFRVGGFWIQGLAGLWLGRNEGMDAYSSPYVTHYSSFNFLFHSFIPNRPKAS